MPNTTIFSSHPKANKMNRISCTTQGKLGFSAKQESYKKEGHGGGAKKGDSAGGGIRYTSEMGFIGENEFMSELG